MPASEESRLPRVLLVEDNPADAEMLRFAVSRAGVPVEIVWLHDGSQAMKHLGLAEPWNPTECDLVLLDINLPVISGFEVLEHIKKHEDLRVLPVIVMSGSANPEDIRRCYRAGANSYISKPAQLEDILTLVSCAVKYWFTCVKLPAAGCAAVPTA